MNVLDERIDYYYGQYLKLSEGSAVSLPGETYILEDGSVLSFPRSDGDNRYQYGEGGFNLWTYTSGNIHANRGLFSLFLRSGEGREPNAAFFFGLKERGEYRVVPMFAALDPDPSAFAHDCGDGRGVRFTVFTAAEAFYFTVCGKILGIVHVYAFGDDSLAFTAIVRNTASESREISLCSYLNPFLRDGLAVSEEDKWFRSCETVEDSGNEEKLKGFFFRINVDLSRTLSVTNYCAVDRAVYVSGAGAGLTGCAATTSRLDFLGGMLCGLHNSAALKRGRFDSGRKVTAFNDTAVAGEMVFASLPPGGSVTLHETLAFRRNETGSCSFEDVRKPADPESFCRELAGKYRLAAAGNRLRMTFKGNAKAERLTAFVPHLIKQVDFCASISGYVQLSANSLVGIRDVFQAIEGNLYSEPEKAREKMLEAFSFIDPSGRAPRQYALPSVPDAPPPMDLRPFIDQGVWIIDTVMTYLRATGDFAFLGEECGYHETVDEARRLVKRSAISDSVLSHMFRIMSYLLSNVDEKTHCVRALYGDWNDALDGLGVRKDGRPGYGSGVSVMASLQVYKNLTDMLELLELLTERGAGSSCSPERSDAAGTQDGSAAENLSAEALDGRIAQYRKARGLLREGLINYAVVENDAGDRRIIHGWGDERSYLVGSFRDNDGRSRVGVTSNAFWVLSGLYGEDKSFRDIILGAFRSLDSTYGLKTFEPGFERTATGFGRIGRLPLGTAENGAVYVHASAFAVRALFEMGEAEEAWRQLFKLLPVFHDRVSLSPYVCPNSYGENPDIGVDGESMTDWQTGSSNVILKSLIGDVFGFRPAFTGLYVRPAMNSPFPEMELELGYCGHRVKIAVSGNQEARERHFRVNGKERACDAEGGIFLDESELYGILGACREAQADDAEQTELFIEVC